MGGKRALAALQEWDARKRQLCSQYSVHLLAVDDTEPLTEEYIAERAEVPYS